MDISGFTPLTESLQHDVEKLSRILNKYFSDLIDIIHSHGGDVIKVRGWHCRGKEVLTIVWCAVCWRRLDGQVVPQGKVAFAQWFQPGQCGPCWTYRKLKIF